MVKLVDFGLAKMLGVGHSVALSMSGTPQYIAPEILSSRAKYSFPVDCWSVGVVMYLLLSGCFPFEPRDSAILDDSMIDVEEYVEVGGPICWWARVPAPPVLTIHNPGPAQTLCFLTLWLRWAGLHPSRGLRV